MTAARLTVFTFIALTIVSLLIGFVGGAILLDRVGEFYRRVELDANHQQGTRIASMLEMLHDRGASEVEILTFFQHTLASSAGSLDRFVCVLSNEGRVLCHPNDQMRGKGADKLQLAIPGQKTPISYRAWVEGNEQVAYLLGHDREPIELIRRVPVGDFPWQVVVHTRLDVLSEQIRGLQRTVLSAFIPIMMAFVLFGSYVARRLGRRYEAAIEKSNRDLERRVEERTAELRQTVEQLQRARDALLVNEKLALLGQLITGIAHEINNPLSAISLHAQSLEEYLENDEDREAVRTINHSAQRCGHLVANLLAFARNSPPQKNAVSANELIEAALGFVRQDLRKTGVAIELKLDPAEPRVLADKIQIEQVVLNLITNALQALSSQVGERRLVVESRQENGHVFISVTDNGPGLPEEIREHLFEPFHTTKGEGKGTGLGLSLCRRFVEHHEGTISHDDAPGGGARFTVMLPAAVRIPQIPALIASAEV